MLDDLAEGIHRNAVSRGEWDHPQDLNKAIEAWIEGLSNAQEFSVISYEHENGCSEDPCLCNPKPKGIAAELVSVIVSCLDFLALLQVDIGEILSKELAHINSRPYTYGDKLQETR